MGNSRSSTRSRAPPRRHRVTAKKKVESHLDHNTIVLEEKQQYTPVPQQSPPRQEDSHHDQPTVIVVNSPPQLQSFDYDQDRHKRKSHQEDDEEMSFAGQWWHDNKGAIGCYSLLAALAILAVWVLSMIVCDIPVINLVCKAITSLGGDKTDSSSGVFGGFGGLGGIGGTLIEDTITGWT